MPARAPARSIGVKWLRRAVQGVLDALRDSRERAARRIIEDHRHLRGK
jgi:hypothetical protein